MFASTVVGGKRNYQIGNSLRLRSSASAYLSRTPGSTSNRRLFTVSAWVKAGPGVYYQLLTAGASSISNGFTTLGVQTNGSAYIVFYSSSSHVYESAALFRDPSAWYHTMFVVDTAQATAADRLKMYVNGTQITLSVTATYTAVPQNFDCSVNTSGASQVIGALRNGAGALASHTDAYIAEQHFIDGQALTPASFGQTDTNGVWVPKAYSGTYGTNGFYLKFNDGSNTTNLCLDRSGNGNNWTPTNVSLTAGATYDWMVDTPTNNYCTLNPIQSFASLTSATNLTIYYANTATWATAASTFAVSSGKWYWETTHSNIVHTTSETLVGILANTSITASLIGNTHVGLQANGYGYYSADGQKWSNGAGAAYGSALTNGDVLGIALDADAGTITFYKNNTSLGTAYSGLTGPYMPAVSSRSGVVESNFGQRPFTYTPPTGFKALCSANLPAVTVTNGKKHFDVLTYTGNAVQDRAVTGFQFDLGLGWIKNRGAVGTHVLVNEVVGGTKQLFSNLTDAEQTNIDLTNGFTTGGIILGDNVTGTGSTNQNTNTYALWGWKANGAGVTNTSGSITSTVSANIAAGFSIVTYTGTGANATVGHGLGVAPKMIIIRNRTNSAVSWGVYHASVGNTGGLYLNLTNATNTSAIWWNNTSPTSSTFALGTWAGVNDTTSMVAYCFTEVPGYSRFGSYTGNGGTDGPFVYCGFRPRWVMIKETSLGTGNWFILDAARDTYNVAAARLNPNTSSAESTANNLIDFTANGFKLRHDGSVVSVNGSGQSYIFAAFAEYPFGGYNVPPANAR